MLNSIGIHVKVVNFKKSYDFYSALGFMCVFEYGPDKALVEDYSGAVFELNGAKIEIADGHRAVKNHVFKERVLSSKISFMVSVSSLYKILKLCEAKRIDIAVSPRHYYWGTLELVVKDPDGVVIVFTCPYSKKEADKMSVDEAYAYKPN